MRKRESGQRLRRMIVVVSALTSVLLSSGVPGQTAPEDDVIRQTAVVRPSSMSLPNGKPEKLEFSIGMPPQTQGWIRYKGDWQMTSTVRHNGLMCATYELSARFGNGNPGCTNVNWLYESGIGTRETQCNGATKEHVAGDIAPELANKFSKITCVEKVVRCKGNCK